MDYEAEVQRLAQDVRSASRIVALSGAGMSVESDIASFRGPGGLWEKYDPEEYGHIDTLRYRPEKAWIMLSEMQREILKAKPNAGHYALAELEKMGKLRAIITQNVDGLHHVAGSREVIEFHGHMQSVSCMDCGHRVPSSEVSLAVLPPRCAKCSGPVKPDAVFFGEAIPADALMRSHREASDCDLMLVVGTSAMVYPAASMPQIAHDAGARVVEVNPSETPLTGRISSYIVKGPSGEVLARLVDLLTNSP